MNSLGDVDEAVEVRGAPWVGDWDFNGFGADRGEGCRIRCGSVDPLEHFGSSCKELSARHFEYLVMIERWNLCFVFGSLTAKGHSFYTLVWHL